MVKRIGIESREFWDLLINELSASPVNNSRLAAIVGHLLLEMSINAFFDEKLPNSDRLINKRFIDKMDVLSGIGAIKDDTYTNLKIMNEIRNQYAHIKNPENLNPDLDIIIGKMKTLKMRSERSAVKQWQEHLDTTPNLTEFTCTMLKQAVIEIILDNLQEDFAAYAEHKK